MTAPIWSDASVEFTHGFPRRLLRHTSHGGFLPGNIIACAKASNLCIRRLGIFDIASTVPKHAIEGVGLSLAKLLTCR